MNYLFCLPFVYREYAEEFLATCKFPLQNIFLIDNTQENRGIMRSHNMGIDRMKEVGADWLIIVSAAIRFGESGGLDFLDHLERMPDHHVVEAEKVFGWHLIAFNRRTIEAIGRWDENFTPYGFDDLDYSYRFQKHFQLTGEKQLWEKVPVDCTDMGMAHSIKIAKVEAPAQPLIEYYRRKWNYTPGGPQDDAFQYPFNDPNNSIAYWPETPNGGRWDA